jgi:phenylalanyl-tRNA synthetase beta chain
MKFPLSWLKEYIEIELPPQQIAKIMTLAGLEVDSIENDTLNFEKVVIGHVLEVAPHPNADKLRVAKVTDGIENFQVVCGAENCRAGMKTALALIGATLKFPDGEVFKIKKSKIRGVESFGMLCSGAELGITDDALGILEFAEHMKVGADVGALYSDPLFEVSLTPNLNHAANLIGIARELSAATGLPLKLPRIEVKEEQEKAQIGIEIADKENCPHYAARIVEGIIPQESPEWLKKRLIGCGIRPSFPAVDITNYVLLETGQPLHAFNLDAIEGKVVVRRAQNQETFKTLDGKERTLSDEMLVIADDKHTLAIAGVMGGEASEVKADTSRILIESAYFRPQSIRRTSKALGLSTDASRRFERGVDPNGIKAAVDRAAMLLHDVFGAKVLKGIVDVQTQVTPERRIKCRLGKVNGLIGLNLSLSEVEAHLQRLNFKTEWDGEETLLVTVPTYRVDITSEVDLVEEVARMVGYENIPRKAPRYKSSSLPHNPYYVFEKEIRERLIGAGLQEFMTCNLIGPSMLETVPDPKMAKEGVVQVINPTSIEQSILRTSLSQGLLHAVKFNWDRESQTIAAFEVGKVHFKAEGGYQEPLIAGIVLAGKNNPYHFSSKAPKVDFYDLKGIIENLLDGLNIRRYTFRSSNIETFHSGRQALIQIDWVDVGSLGEIHPSIQRKLDIPERIYFAELNLVDLLNAKRGDLKMRTLSLYPASERDWTVTVPKAMAVQQLISSIQRIPSDLLEEVSLVDIFESEKIGLDVKNVTLHFVYRDKQKTIAQEQVDSEHARILATAGQMVSSFQN